MAEFSAHERGFRSDGPAPAHWPGDYRRYLDGYFDGFRRAFWQAANARFGESTVHSDVIYFLKDLWEVTERADRLPTATDWRDLLKPVYDRLLERERARAAAAAGLVLRQGTARFGEPPDEVRRVIRRLDRPEYRVDIERIADRLPTAAGWADLFNGWLESPPG